MIKKMECILLLSLLLSVKETIWSEEKAFDLSEIVVTGDPVAKEVEESPVSITVIDRDEIEKSGAQTLSDVLSGVPGIFVHKTGMFGRTDPEIRGIGERGRKIVILIDGVPVKMSLFGCAVTHSLPIANVERIEVIRGPNSVLYGSDALGGVINIITRKMDKEGFWTDVTVSGGTYNTFQSLITHGGKVGRFDYFLTMDKIWSDGHREQSEYLSSDYTLKMGYELTPTLSLSFFGKYFHGKEYSLGPVGGTVPPDIPDDYERTSEYITISEKNTEYNLSFTLSHNYGYHKLKDGWRSTDNIYGASIAYTTFALDNNELTMGGDWRWFDGENLTPPFNGDWDRNEYGLYIWNKHKWESLSLTLGGRYQYDSVAGGTFCPQGGVVYNISEKSRLRAQVSKAYRFPAINDLYIFPKSNEDLKPETVWSYEAGLDHNITDYLTGNLTFFIMDGSDLIQSVTNPTPPPPAIFQNTGDFHFKGIETGLEANWKNSRLTLYYTYLDPGRYTTGRPGNKFDLTHRYRWSQLSLYSSIQHVSNYYAGDNKTDSIPDFFVVNSKLTYDINKNLQAFLGVDNIFDEDYLIYADLPSSEIGKYPMPGRTFTLGMKGSF
jgi:outer membrane cobalamin receptor